MRISQLPQQLRKIALEYQKHSDCDKTTDNLRCAFNWEHTLEGFYYWSNFHYADFKPMNLLEKIYDRVSNYLFGGINCNPKG
jgi:hypothetical protein